MDANYWINKLKLEKHIEGGYFAEYFRSNEKIAKSALPERYDSDRFFNSQIYFLLNSCDKSRFHRIKSDETWYFVEGDVLWLYLLNPNGELETIILGKDFENGEVPQYVIPRGYWMAAEVLEPNSFVLLTCSVSPAFEYSDFELCDKVKLKLEYPKYTDLIERMG